MSDIPANTTARVHGVGVGPGDPELLTLKAVRVIRAAQVLAWPVVEGEDSLARRIAAPHLHGGHREIAIPLPLRRDGAGVDRAYGRAADEIDGHLRAGRGVAVLCLGDPLFYGSFARLGEKLAARWPVEIVPGVCAPLAAGAATGLGTILGSGSYMVLPGTLADDALEARLRLADAAAIIKVGRHADRIRRLLERLDLADRAVHVRNATLPDQHIRPLAALPPGPVDYFSLILIPGRRDAF